MALFQLIMPTTHYGWVGLLPSLAFVCHENGHPFEPMIYHVGSKYCLYNTDLNISLRLQMKMDEIEHLYNCVYNNLAQYYYPNA